MTARPKRIVIVSHYYPPHTGGIELVAKNQAERLAALGYIVTVVAAGVSLKEPTGMVNGVRVLRVPSLNSLEKHGVPFPLPWPVILFSTLFAAIRKADVVHIHDAAYVPCFTAAIVAKILRRPVVMTQHVGYIPHNRLVVGVQKVMHRTAGYIAYRSSRIVYTLNDRVAVHALEHGVRRERLKQLMNGVDTKLFYPATEYEKIAAREKFGLNHDKLVVLFVGRNVPKKGYDKVVAAAGPDYQIVCAGGDVGIGDEPYVVHLGKLPQEELAQVYRAADVFVLPSEGEGFPMSVQEAMASGLPVITTDDPGYARYKLDPAYMYLLKKPTAAAVRKALADLANNPVQRNAMGKYVRGYAIAHFSWQHIIRQLDTDYASIIGSKKAAA